MSRRRNGAEGDRRVTLADVPDDLRVFDADGWTSQAEWLAARDEWAARNGVSIVLLVLNELRRQVGQPPLGEG